MPCAADRLAQLCRQRIDRAAFDASSGNDRLATDAERVESQRHALERLALKTIAKDIGPGDGEAGIGRTKRRYLHALGGEGFRPCTIGTEPRPACAAQRQHGRAWFDLGLSVGCLKLEAAVRIPPGPAMAQGELH